jgi:hypothetical protein
MDIPDDRVNKFERYLRAGAKWRLRHIKSEIYGSGGIFP